MSMLLKSIGGEFHEYYLGKDFNDGQFLAEFGDEAEYPQVAIGNTHVGGMKDALRYLVCKEII